MKIAIYGIGYVGKTYSELISKKYKVTAYDKDIKRIKKFIKLVPKQSHKNQRINYTSNIKDCFKADIGLICISTNWDKNINHLETKHLGELIKKIHFNSPHQIILIKSTVPVGTTEYLVSNTGYHEIYYLPEFLRENHSLSDVKKPSRIIIGGNGQNLELLKRLISSNYKESIPVLCTSASEAEAIKLFSNSFLAMRVAFFNEVSNFSCSQNLSEFRIIKGISLDPRIGDFYNHPSYGYGGYCLPKDIRELDEEFFESNISSNLLTGTIKSNYFRKKYIVNKILKKGKKTIGIYNLETNNPKDFRYSPLLDIIDLLIKNKKNVIIYEENTNLKKLKGCLIYNKETITEFLSKSDIIIAGKDTYKIRDYNKEIIGF